MNIIYQHIYMDSRKIVLIKLSTGSKGDADTENKFWIQCRTEKVG